MGRRPSRRMQDLLDQWRALDEKGQATFAVEQAVEALKVQEKRTRRTRAIVVAGMALLVLGGAIYGGFHLLWNGRPETEFVYSPINGTPTETVEFSATSARGRIDSSASFVWNFGDGSALASGTSVSHRFSAPGQYDVVLSIQDARGVVSTSTKRVVINAPPSARFSFSPATPVAGVAAQFDAGQSKDSDGAIASYTWDFGDGDTQQPTKGVALEHKFARSALYTVVLTVTDDRGGAAQFRAVISVLSASKPTPPQPTSTVPTTTTPSIIPPTTTTPPLIPPTAPAGTGVLHVIRQDGALCLAISSDGRYLACGTSAGKVALYDTTTWAVLHTVEGHGSAVRAVTFSPDSTTLATGSDDTLVKLWSIPDGALRLTISAGAKVNALSFAPYGGLLAVGKDTRLEIYDASTGSSVRRFPNNACKAVSFCPTGGLLAAASLYNVQLLDTASWSEVAKLAGGGSVSDIAFSPSGQLLAVSCWDNESVRIYSASTRTLVNNLKTGQTLCVAYDSASRLLATGPRMLTSSESTVQLWKASLNEVGHFQDLEGHHGSVGAVAFNPRGGWLASCAADGTVRVWQAP